MNSHLILSAAIILSGCSTTGPHTTATAGRPTAVAELAPTSGNAATGTTTFTRQGEKVLVEARFKGLTPGVHGFHIHEKGDCSSGDGMSTGDHFNPAGGSHGSPGSMKQHGGDLGNLTADASGNAVLNATVVMPGVTFEKTGAGSIHNRGLIVHADPDDYTTQPTGNSGKRVACGVISLR